MRSINKFIVTCPTTGCPSLRRQQIELKEPGVKSGLQTSAPPPSGSPWACSSTPLGFTALFAKHFSPDQVAPFLNTCTQLKGQCTLLSAIKVWILLLPAVMEKKSFILKVLRILYHYRLSAYQYKFLFFYHITFKSWTDLSSRWSVHLQWLG